MDTRKRGFTLFVMMGVLLSAAVSLYGAEHKMPMHKGAKDTGSAQTQDYPSMAAPGSKVPIGNGFYLIYGFDKKPKMGTVILKVEDFNAEGKKDTSLELKADAGMPSMRGAHDTGDRPLALSKKGDYLLPIDIVMPGGWEIRLTVLKGGKVLFGGKYNFDV